MTCTWLHVSHAHGLTEGLLAGMHNSQGTEVRLAYTGIGPYTGTGYSGIYTGIFSDCGIWAR
jgi:hypothetical protein